MICLDVYDMIYFAVLVIGVKWDLNPLLILETGKISKNDLYGIIRLLPVAIKDCKFEYHFWKLKQC